MSRLRPWEKDTGEDWAEAVEVGAWFGSLGFILGGLVALVGWLATRRRRAA